MTKAVPKMIQNRFHQKTNWKIAFALAAVISAIQIINAQQPAKISVDMAHPTHPISPLLWGIFFEDINLSADGGVYPELVRNRSFEDSNQPEFWKLTGDNIQSAISVESSQPLNTFNLHYLQVNVTNGFTLENNGYWGMNIIKGENYTFKTALRGESLINPLTVKLVGTNGNILASGEISAPTHDWQYQTIHLTASASDPQAHLEISGTGTGTLFLDMVSVMPEVTWKHHGLRPDLCEAMDALHPSFMRFPGGNWIEGDNISTMYHWKDTIGNIDARAPLWNTWGYNTTQGLGFYEYLQLCEDLGAAPVFGVNCGMSLNGHAVPMSRMGQWVQDALDAIQYANGPTNSVWGSLRAQAGHPAPLNLQYLEIGNENGGPDYWQRWKLMVDAIRAKYPDIKFIMTTSLSGYPYPPEPSPDIIDEHYYESAESFMQRAHQYDHYDRKGPKIFIGEYAVTQNAGEGNLRAAIGEAAFMTGMERNSDVVAMASYAPLFLNVNHRAWNPDLINFDDAHWYGIPSYYVQKMFAENRGDVELPAKVISPTAIFPASHGQIGVGTWNTEAEFKDVKVTAPDGTVLLASDFSKNPDVWKKLGPGDWSVQDGALQQHAEQEFVRAIAGDQSWTDYTLTLKARKLGGREGFLILFHISHDEDRTWWNIGGWNNTQDALENGGTLDRKPGQIETGRWYDIRLDVRGKNVKCYLDGVLVHDVNYQHIGNLPSLYACASRDTQTGDLIVKVANGSATPIKTELNLEGAKNLTGQGVATVLTSEDPGGENSLENPTNIAPTTEPITLDSNHPTWTFPENSFTVLRLKSKTSE